MDKGASKKDHGENEPDDCERGFDKPAYSLRINPSPHALCIDCEEPTGKGVVGFRNQGPLCDACLFVQEPQLGTPLAMQSTIRFLGSALGGQRPRADGRPLLMLSTELDESSITSRIDPRGLQDHLGRSWEELWGDCEEMALEMRYDLRMIARRLEAEGYDSRPLDDPEWVMSVVQKARERGIEPRDLLEERAKGESTE